MLGTRYRFLFTNFFDHLHCMTFRFNFECNFECVAGAHVPLTMEGKIVVDGVLASCYPSCHHDVAHIGMKPLSWFPEVTKWIFGEDNKFLVYVNILEYVGRLVIPDELLDI